MVASAPGGYKERYLRALEDSERLERQFEFQLDSLRKTVINLSAAAHGLDKTLDSEMIGLKEKLRGAKGAQVLEQMDKVQAAVSQFEKNRDAENSAAAKAMAGLIEQYVDLNIPKGTKQRLQKFSAGLKQGLSTYRMYPVVLAEIAKLQQAALEAAAEPPKNFWQRLKPGRRLKPQGEESDVLVGTIIEKDRDKSKNREKTEIGPGDSDSLQLDINDSELRCDRDDSGSMPVYETSRFRGLEEDEEGYEPVALRISQTLAELIAKIQPNELIKHKVDIVRTRIQRGMDWYALAITLEDIRDILLLRYLDVDREFSNYLKQVNEELLVISKVLGVALEKESSQRKAAGAFTDAVSNQVERLRNSVENSGSIEELKQEVSDHLGQIQLALTQYRTAEKAQEKIADGDGSLTNQLQSLIERVHSIESESKKTKELLEEERYKATHDPLTGVPNREAYNEKAFEEVQRFKRYSRPLTIAVCDIDHFKRINDGYGHQAGDKVLKLIARILATRLRKVDFVARYGGEEFVILMPETTASQGLSVLDKIRKAIGKSAFRFKDEPVTITISFGIASLVAEDTLETAFARADGALYQAKDDGRNRCVIAVSPDVSDGPSDEPLDEAPEESAPKPSKNN